MKGFMAYFFEQHKRMILSYSVVILISLIFAVSLKTTSVPAAVTILYISIFATLSPVASLNSDREIDQLLSLPGGRKSLVKAQYLNAVFAIFASLVAAVLMILLAMAFTLGKAHLPSAQIVSVILSVSMIVIAVMQPLSMIFGRKGLLIGFAVLTFITLQSFVRTLLTNGGVVLFQLAKEYLAGPQIEGVSVIVNDGMTLPDFLNLPSVITFAGTAITLFVSSYVIARLVISRKNFRVNKL